MKTSIYIFIFVVLFGIASKAQYIGYRIDDNKNKTVFKFELINNLIIVPVVVNDSIPLHFILDTGVRTTLLTDNNIDNLDVSSNTPVKINALGSANNIEAFVISNVKIQLPGITGIGQTLIVLGEDYLNLESHIGKEVNGILGYDFFQHFIVQINYSRKTVTVYDNKEFEIGKKFESIPIRIESGRPYIDAVMTQINGTTIDGCFLIDTGASHGLLVESDKDSTIVLPEKTLKTIVGWGLGGEVPGDLGRIKTFKIGSFNFNKVLVSFASEILTQTLSGQKTRTGSIGGEILSRFTCVYNYKENLVYLKKNNNYRRSFEYNLSGLDLVAFGDNFNIFKVVYVVENSPAAIAGILPGDTIVAINGKVASDLSLDEINGLFRSDVGLTINAIVMRNNSFHSFKFRLKRII